MMNRKFLLAISASVLAFIGCEHQNDAALDSAGPSPEVASAPWLLTESPGTPRGVAELKREASEGEAVVLRGRIGGSREPISVGSVIFTVVDVSVPSCAENPEDTCRTPWDYCCEPREVLTANMATVQVVDSAGDPIGGDLSEVLSPLETVVVIGTVGPRANEGVLLVRATGIYREGE